ncbi:MAG TPA: bifunctional phosphopantothenoylcysteine decarboxylase/phosphopantothenate--cysteine ligase CoaBC [Puia sp.]|jgi:phosphopantothenoylcysteine decarboxylase/phosphopantothenate--cysteine ligase|nr:bifunctional phosphopantothenoylcysteine decarboxylase/phosphopantothenate--cysteine ligase CoaBC [Puia sp.]
MSIFQGKKILLGVTGSIAAYKSLLVIRLLIKEGAAVKVIQTPASKDFVTPLSLSTLSKNPVLADLADAGTWANHVELGRWADLLLIAPLSCNTLAKMAHGICDNLLLATYLSAVCPVVAAPAMDEDMWRHPATLANLERLRAYGNRIIPVGNGELASGLYGDGRMAEPEEILNFIGEVIGGGGRDTMTAARAELAGKRALVTAGPTYEAIDPVRYIGNHSSGKMGVALAEELAARGAEVDLVLGPSPIGVDRPGVVVHRVVSAEEMYKVCADRWVGADIGILSAAVADYRPVEAAKEKIKKTGENLTLELTRTTDILKTLGGNKRKGQVLVGFALEGNDERVYALGKLKAKNADLIVLNSLNDAGATFGYDTNKITVFGQDGLELSYERKPKQQVAKDIVDQVVKLL